MESYSRVRSVKLKRGSGEEPFGFSVRGGHEHGTGIFVSFVDPRSVAYRQGLKVGDQILRVNGFPVSAAVHHECLSLMKIRTSLHLKVRSVGMLPVKEKSGDPLTWKLVEEQPSPELLDGEYDHDRGSESSSDALETKVTIDLTGQSGLGCCICKGPPERPGIFVQSTKCNGVAREAGLRPGDQVLSCNGHSFLHIQFAEAVYYLKSSKVLKLRVLKGAASDLFPGESSGYNSSASSLNGDTSQSGGAGESSSTSSPSVHGDVHLHNHHHQHQHQQMQMQMQMQQQEKRLSMVTEEVGGSSGDRSVALDRSMEWDEVEQVWRKAEKETLVIEVRGEDPKVQRLRSEEERLAEERRRLEETQLLLREEAQRLEEDKRKFEEEKRRSEESRTMSPTTSLVSSSGQSETQSGSGSGTNSLAGALTQEILKRNERRESNGMTDERPKPGTVEQKRSLFNTHIDHEKRQQHEQLIEEFKRAHRKMFAHTVAQENANAVKDAPSGAESLVIKSRRVQKELDHERQMVAQRVAGIVRQRQLRIERQHQECAETEREVTSKAKGPPPPPPPPMPSELGLNSAKGSKCPPAIAAALTPKPVIIEEKSGGGKSESPSPLRPPSSSKGPAPPPPKPVQKSPSPPHLQNGNGNHHQIQHQNQNQHSHSPQSQNQIQHQNHQQNMNNHHNHSQQVQVQQPQQIHQPEEKQRPESPSPDYSDYSPSPVSSPPRPQRKPLGVDMQSLESFRLKDPPRSPKKPPPVYFNHQLLQSASGPQMRMSSYPRAPLATTRLDLLRDGVELGQLGQLGQLSQMGGEEGAKWLEGNMKPILKMGQSTSHTPKQISFGGRY